MAANVVVDSGFLVAILMDRDANHRWAVAVSEQNPPLWKTCEAALAEAFHLLGRHGAPSLIELLRRGAVACDFRLHDHSEAVVALMRKYVNTPMSLADACLVRMSEILRDPVLLTTDTDFRVYRRHGRQIVPCILPR